MNKLFKISIILLVFLLCVVGVISFFTQDKRAAEKVANEFFSSSLPPKTTVLKKGYDYGVGYGGGPTGSGGYSTVAAYQTLSSTLSEKEVTEYYKKRNVELYFNGDEKVMKTSDGRLWYEGVSKKNLSTKRNTNKPITFIIQVRTEFASAFGEFAKY